MSSRPRAFDGHAFDDDAFDCELFEQVVSALQTWIPETAQGALWTQVSTQPDSWIASDNDDGF